MSGFERDYDTGRKFQSGMLKRKQNGELEKKNKELSGSLKFLKMNEDASFTVAKILVRIKVESRWRLSMNLPTM
jgi:hypothetical protein